VGEQPTKAPEEYPGPKRNKQLNVLVRNEYDAPESKECEQELNSQRKYLSSPRVKRRDLAEYLEKIAQIQRPAETAKKDLHLPTAADPQLLRLLLAKLLWLYQPSLWHSEKWEAPSPRP
jgi:hypothetical protein